MCERNYPGPAVGGLKRERKSRSCENLMQDNQHKSYHRSKHLYEVKMIACACQASSLYILTIAAVIKEISASCKYIIHSGNL